MVERALGRRTQQNEVSDSPKPRLLRGPLARPWIWALGWIIWLSVLWILSGGPPPVENDDVGIPHIDKILHAGYFFGGAGMLCAYLWLLQKKKSTFRSLMILSLLILGGVGISDEYHQSLNPERTGNSWADFAADLVGSALGAVVFWRSKDHAFGPALTADEA